MIRTDQKGKWQLEAITVHRFKTKREMDKFALNNAVRIIRVIEFVGKVCYDRQIGGWGSRIRLTSITDGKDAIVTGKQIGRAHV